MNLATELDRVDDESYNKENTKLANETFGLSNQKVVALLNILIFGLISTRYASYEVEYKNIVVAFIITVVFIRLLEERDFNKGLLASPLWETCKGSQTQEPHML